MDIKRQREKDPIVYNISEGLEINIVITTFDRERSDLLLIKNIMNSLSQYLRDRFLNIIEETSILALEKIRPLPRN